MATIANFPPDLILQLKAEAKRRLLILDEEKARSRQQESATSTEETNRLVREATQSCWHWLRNYTRTENPHWKKDGLDSAYLPFPDKPYFPPLLDWLDAVDVGAVEKSRDMMASWAIMGYFTFQAMTVPARTVVCQTMSTEKVIELVGYARTLYSQQPLWLQEAFPLNKPLDRQPSRILRFAHGGAIIGISGGKDKMRSYHPWGFFEDEIAFIPDGIESFTNAEGGGTQKIILNSSAGPGPFSDWKRDIGA